MAKYEVRYLTGLCTCHAGNYTAADDTEDLEILELYLDDGDGGDQTFTPGETLTLYDLFGEVETFTYLGYTEDGMILDFEGAPLYFGNRPLQQGDQPAFTANALAVCFYPGTLIATPEGARGVETLAAGDLVLTAAGGVAPIQWIGRQSVTTVFADPLRVLPVTVRAGALGNGLPVRDLTLSPDHALLVDGMLVHAGALVNGTTIVRMAGVPPRFTYWHVELADHALILAEGVAAETFLDNGARRRFDNWAECEAEGGDAPAVPLDLPRVTSARALPAGMRRKLAVLADAPAMSVAA